MYFGREIQGIRCNIGGTRARIAAVVPIGVVLERVKLTADRSGNSIGKYVVEDDSVSPGSANDSGSVTIKGIIYDSSCTFGKNRTVKIISIK